MTISDNPNKIGTVIVPKGVAPKSHELLTANRLAILGHQVIFQTPINEYRVKNPDILLDGEIWEMKSPHGNGTRTIDNNLREAGHQGRFLVLDLIRLGINWPDDKVIAFVRYRMKIRHLEKVLVLHKMPDAKGRILATIIVGNQVEPVR